MRHETAQEHHEFAAEARDWQAVNARREAEQRGACPIAAELRDEVDELVSPFGLEEWGRLMLLNRAWTVLSDALDDFRDLGPALAADVRQVIAFAKEREQ